MNSSLLRNPVAIGIISLLIVILLASTFVIVPETKQAVILRFEQPVGQPVNAYKPNEQFGNTGAGLIAKVPFFDRVDTQDRPKRITGRRI